MKKELKEIIKKSGNNLHITTVDLLEKIQWSVSLSSYYYDDTANKPREIDITAKNNIPIMNDATKEKIDSFDLFLFIECKYFKNEVAFRSRLNNKQEAKEAMIIEAIEKVDGWDKKIILERDGLFRDHHYSKERFIGRLYDTKNQNSMFNAITQPIKSLTFFKERSHKKGIYYPLVIYSGIGGIFPIRKQEADLTKLSLEKRSIFGLDYSYRSSVDEKLKTNKFFIDFIHQDELEKFIEDTILREAEELKNCLFFKKMTRKS